MEEKQESKLTEDKQLKLRCGQFVTKDLNAHTNLSTEEKLFRFVEIILAEKLTEQRKKDREEKIRDIKYFLKHLKFIKKSQIEDFIRTMWEF